MLVGKVLLMCARLCVHNVFPRFVVRLFDDDAFSHEVVIGSSRKHGVTGR